MSPPGEVFNDPSPGGFFIGFFRVRRGDGGVSERIRMCPAGYWRGPCDNGRAMMTGCPAGGETATGRRQQHDGGPRNAPGLR
jgi:hypothetical protein